MSQDSLFLSIGYYFWLIPSIISFSFSLIVLFRNIFLKLSVITILEIFFCLFDIIQSISWFIGPIYSINNNNTSICHLQEILFEYSLLSKACILLIACGIFAKYTYTRKKFSIIIPSLIIIIFTLIMMILSYIYKSRIAACQGLIKHKIETSTTPELSYIFFFVLPLTIYAYLIIILSLIGISYRQQNSLVSALLSTIYDRLVIFCIIVFLVMIPFHCFYILAALGRMNIVIYCLTGFIVSSSGAFFSFYILVAPFHEKWKKFNLFFFIEIMLSDERDDSDNEFIEQQNKQNEISNPRDNSLSQRLWYNMKLSESSLSFGRQSESELIPKGTSQRH